MTYLEAEDVYRKAREMAFEGFVSPLDSLPDDIQDVEGYCHPQPANNLRFQLQAAAPIVVESSAQRKATSGSIINKYSLPHRRADLQRIAGNAAQVNNK